MADADLFMECEEEELEPWQQMNDDVDDEEVVLDGKTSAASDNVETSYAPPFTTVVLPISMATPAIVSSATPIGDAKLITPLFTTTTTTITSPISSVLPPGSSLVPQGLPKAAPGQQIILTQSPQGLGTVAMSQVLQPMQVVSSALPGTGSTNQPIFFTTQGFPVRNVRPGQNSVNPLGIVLNVQQGQTVRPITLVPAPGTQLFRPAVGVPQAVSQLRPTTAVLSRPPTTTYTTVQIPATLTIRSSIPISQPEMKSITTITPTTTTTTQLAGPSVLTQPPHTQPAFQALATGNSRRFVVQGDRVIEVQEATDHGASAVSGPVVQKTDSSPVRQTPVVVTGPSSSPILGQPQPQQLVLSVAPGAVKVCPGCGAQFRVIEALRGHMCTCCPDIYRNIIISDSRRPIPSTNTPILRVPPTLLPAPPTTQPNPIPTASSSTPSTLLVDSGLQSGIDSQGKLVMLVEDFYYGSYPGSATDHPQEMLQFKCLSCTKKLKNNIRLMNHMKHHVEMEQQNGEVDTHTYCQHCYRQFPTPFRLQCHVESVHSHFESTTKCKICEWAFESEPVFLQHMKNTHKPGEMPYVCQVCEYRSSFYVDVCNHFRLKHEDTRFLLCVYCLKVFRNSNAYQQHYIRHQKKTIYHCNKCRLQFLFTKDKVEHKLNHHKTFRKPKQLEGLLPGTKVTIRAYAVQNKGPESATSTSPLPTPTGRDSPSPQVGEVSRCSPLSNAWQPPTRKRPVSKMLELMTRFQERGEIVGKHKCLECNYDVSDFPNHYPSYVHCSLCRYSTCCCRAYANHMISMHIPRKNNSKYLALYKRPVPSMLTLICTLCGYVTQLPDQMANHLVQNPGHDSSLCATKERLESDIEFSEEEEEEEEDEEELGGNGESEVAEKKDKASIDSLDIPQKSITVQAFTSTSGPCHSLTKYSDAIDYFNLLFPSSLMEIITQETNVFAANSTVMGEGDPSWTPVSVREIQGFLGLSILMGLQSLPDPTMYWSWQRYESYLTFHRTMPFTRYQQIASNIRVTSQDMLELEHGDKLRLIRPILDILNSTMWNAYNPNQCLTIDRALIPGVEVEGSKKQILDWPAVWLLCDSKSGYCHRIFIQTNHSRPEKDSSSEVVLPLVDELKGKHHQLFLASSLTSIPLMLELLDSDIYCSSSFPPQSPILPKEFWEEGQLDKPGDFYQRQFGPLLATRWRDNKEICCISTNAEPGLPDAVWRKSHLTPSELYPIDRPKAFRLLQENMRGVDICNQLQTCNSVCGLPQDTRWRCLFWFLVNLTVVNSFIVLRETRKDNPPLWVEDGRFSQARYRKRLGFQLAKYAQRGCRQTAREDRSASLQTGAGQEPKVAQEPVAGWRHRLGKITPKTKRCRNCTLKNLRHESVYGCVVCRVNLCKRTRCFWEFHGFSPKNQGSPKVGFVVPNNRYLSTPGSSDASTTEGKPALCKQVPILGMAPVEDTDLEQSAGPDEGEEPSSTDTTVDPPEREEALSVRQLRIVLFALCCGIPQAAEHFSTEPCLIQAWLKERKRQLSREQREPQGGEAEERLIEWVLSQQEQQLPVNEKNFFQQAFEIHSRTSPLGCFRISYEWAVGFMLQHDLGVKSWGASVHHRLPSTMEEKSRAFTEFLHKQIPLQGFAPWDIGAMDELAVDLDLLAEPSATVRESAFHVVNSGEPVFDIFLGALADGTLLPIMVFITGHLPARLRGSLPDSVLVEAKAEGFTDEEKLEHWLFQVWQKHIMMRSGVNAKSLLLLDGFRSHLNDSSLVFYGGSGTLPAVVPLGCTSRQQPLEMCVRPALKCFLLDRWTQLAAKGGMAGASFRDLVQLLVAWLIEAVDALKVMPDLLRRSFHAANVFPDSEKDAANTPKELLRAMVEILLGTETASSTPEPEEDEEEEEEEEMAEVNVKTVDVKEEKLSLVKAQEIVHRKDGRTANEVQHPEQKATDPLQDAEDVSTPPTTNVVSPMLEESDAESFYSFKEEEVDKAASP